MDATSGIICSGAGNSCGMQPANVAFTSCYGSSGQVPLPVGTVHTACGGCGGSVQHLRPAAH